MRELSSDLCIIGAGPAGLTIAREFINSPVDTIVLESGDVTEFPRAQVLNDGETVGAAYSGLRATRFRGMGGTARLWNTSVDNRIGAKYVPLDVRDFNVASGKLPGWPLDHADLRPYYEQAQELCGLGPYRYGAAGWQSVNAMPFDLEQTSLTSGVYQFGSVARWTVDHVDAIRSADNIRVMQGTTAGHFLTDGKPRVKRLYVKDTRTGDSLTIKSNLFVLAAGAVENARILLLSGLGNVPGDAGLVGRCFMEHPRDGSLRLVPSGPDFSDRAAFYDMHTSDDGTVIGGRLAPRSDSRHRESCPNFSVTLLPQPSPQKFGRRMLERLGFEGEHRGYGWSRCRSSTLENRPFNVLLNIEQFPCRENRICLAGEKDALGYPRSTLYLAWRQSEQLELDKIVERVAQGFSDARLGIVERLLSASVDLNAHHHAGTTRMALSPQDGVVDPTCRVFGTDNIFVAGGSVFATAGFANPVLTIVALSLRLAFHLRHQV